MRRLSTITGTSAETRQQALGERKSEFDKEMSGFDSGPTGTQLRDFWQESGGEGTMDEFYSGKFGKAYTAPGGQGGGEGESARRSAASNPMAAAAAPVAGVGPDRQWWAL